MQKDQINLENITTANISRDTESELTNVSQK